MVNLENLPSTKTPLNAENLNKMQTDITSVRNLQTYTNPSQFGLNSYTSIAQICSAMPNGSELAMEITNLTFTDFNKTAGFVLEIIKMTEFRCKVEIHNSLTENSTVYVNHWRSDNGLSDWVEIKNTNMLTNEEFETSELFNGQKIYGKRIALGPLPNNTTKEYDLDISSSYVILKVEGLARNSTTIIPLGFGHGSTAVNTISFYLIAKNNKWTAVINTLQDRSSLAGYVIAYYVKP